MTAEGGLEERHEVKFAAYSIELPVVQNWLQMHPDGFIRPFPDRRVNNVYFDNFDYRAYAENLAGVSERSKVRYRWYGDSPSPDAGALEVKRKRNYFGWKLRFDVPNAPYAQGGDWLAVRHKLREQLPANARLWLDQNPLPVMINRYLRHYYCTADHAIRVTIDHEQSFFDQRNGHEPNFYRSATIQDSLVVEFKFARSDRLRASRLLAGFPIRVSRHSKYMNGVKAVGLV